MTPTLSRDIVRSIVHRLPILVTVFILFSTWMLFLVTVSIQQVLLNMGEVWRFIGQILVFHTLLLLAIFSYIPAVNRNPIHPERSLTPPDARPLKPDEEPIRRPWPRREHRRRLSAIYEGEGQDDDDIPLRLLRQSNQRTLLSPEADRSLPPAVPSSERRPSELSPRAQQQDDGDGDADVEDYDDGDGEENQLLSKHEGSIALDVRNPLMAKNGTGGHRWCRKCDAWKPDRAHHCRRCRQCVLKMDHHCPWINNCVGFHNYKAFVLFCTYTGLLCVYGAFEAGYEAYRFVVEPPTYGPGEVPNNGEDYAIALLPMCHMLLAALGVMFGVAVGGLAAYHWYLLLHNRTTMEDMYRAVPTALLDADRRSVVEALGASEGRRRTPGAWRADHILTRPERSRLRQEAKEINVYDLGWKQNFYSVFLGEDVEPATSWRPWARDILRAAWPLSAPRPRHRAAGHYYAYDRAKLQRLKSLTAEMRLGLDETDLQTTPTSLQSFTPPTPRTPPEVPGVRDYHVQRTHNNQWTIGDTSDSEQSDESHLIDG